MTPEAQAALARRLAAHEKWEWREGMAWFDAPPGQLPSGGRCIPTGRERRFVIPAHGYAIPNLDDPATWGVLLGMLVEADGTSAVLCVSTAAGARVSTYQGKVRVDAAAAGEALARALLEVWDG